MTARWIALCCLAMLAAGRKNPKSGPGEAKTKGFSNCSLHSGGLRKAPLHLVTFSPSLFKIDGAEWGGFEPEFTEAIANVTVATGRDAVFTCTVANLGGHKVFVVFFPSLSYCPS